MGQRKGPLAPSLRAGRRPPRGGVPKEKVGGGLRRQWCPSVFRARQTSVLPFARQSEAWALLVARGKVAQLAWTTAPRFPPRTSPSRDAAPAHLSETVPIPQSNSLIFWPAFAVVTLVGRGVSEPRSRLQVIKRPLADKARSSTPPEDGHGWGLVNGREGHSPSSCPRTQDKCWRKTSTHVRS